MAVALVRVALYVFEWLWTVVVMGIIPSQLVMEAPLRRGGRGAVCGLNWALGLSRCNFGIAWAAIAFAVLTVAIAWHCLSWCTTHGLPCNVELVFFAWLTLWWLVGAITLTAVKSGKAPAGARIVVAFAWMLVFMCLGSAVIAGRASDKKANAMANAELAA